MTKTPLHIALALCMGLAINTSCKKNTDVLAAPPPPSNTGGSGVGTPGTAGAFNADLLKDTALMYARDIYLWNTQIPQTFNARSYADPAAIMTAIQPYSMEPGFSQPVDKWSFAMKKTEWDNMSGGMSSTTLGSDGDFGLSVFFKAEGDLRVRLVEPNSPAGLAGVRRGWRITQINGSSNISTSNATNIVNDVYYSSSSSFTFLKPDGATVSRNFVATHYTETPVYLDSVYNIGSSKIGYLVYNSFLGNTTDVASKLQQVFSRFASKGITDVVVDLRYNGGGYVSLAEQMANYLAPASANGGLMMKQQYNSQNTQNNSTTYFRKQGSINLPKAYFIVSKSTASASELLINTLKPYMDVRIIGPSNTHGKPVGFFPISDGDWYVFPVSFRTVNKNGEGNYFNGIPVNTQVADGLDKDWGDATESCLASALRNITTGGFMSENNNYKVQPEVAAGNARLDEPFLKITVDKK